MVSWWLLAFFGALFVVSILTLSRVQHRWISRFGWRVFHQRTLKELYWDELTRTERWLAFPGIAAFLLILLTLVISSLLIKFLR